MLTLLGIVTAHAAFGHGSLLLGLGLALGALGIVLAPSLQYKNSGILRYRFGLLPTGLTDPDAFAGPLVGGVAQTPIYCLGGVVGGAGASLATPDMDRQLFGMTPGHAAITGATVTLFDGSNPPQRDADPVGNRVQGDPNTGASPASVSFAGARIPAGTKVLAWFEPSAVTFGATPPIQPLVQTEVFQNRIFKGGIEDATGPQWLSSLRVAIINPGANSTAWAGMLYVKIQHSHLDIPGTVGQSMQDIAAPPS